MPTDRVSAKREEILLAAAQVFREEGYETTSMDRIAERAGASKRTVYNHFGSKEALFHAVLSDLIEAQIAAKQIPWDPDRPLAEQLRAFALAKGAIAEDEASMALMRVVLSQAIRDPAVIEPFLERFTREEDALVAWLGEAHAAGALEVPDPELAASLFWATAGGALFWPVAIGLPPDPQSRERMIEELVETFLMRYAGRPQAGSR